MRAASGAHQGKHPGVLGTVAAVLRVLVVGVFLQTFVLQTYQIPSGSMIPTMLVGDCVLVSKAAYDDAGSRRGAWRRLERSLLPPSAVHRGDMVVFHFPPEPSHLLVKRVIGMPGDRLHLRNGRVFLNDIPLQEPYAMYTAARPDVFRDEFPNLNETDPNVDPAWWLALRRTLRQDGNVLIPPDHYFVLGDNRNNSEDSRYWGFVPQAGIVGEPALIYFAVPNGADAPPGGPLPRLRWVSGWVRQRIGVLH
ncbi:MAG TPA: signal peptidase I [Acidobacteriaceae bacterium]|nr:signal peptidase I [Acidobacteriaceae bacterium]